MTNLIKSKILFEPKMMKSGFFYAAFACIIIFMVIACKTETAINRDQINTSRDIIEVEIIE